MSHSTYSLLIAIISVLIYLIPVYIVADIAKSKGKSFWLYLVLGLFLTPFASLLIYSAVQMNSKHNLSTNLVNNSHKAKSFGYYHSYYWRLAINIITNFAVILVPLVIMTGIVYIFLSKGTDHRPFWWILTAIAFFSALHLRYHLIIWSLLLRKQKHESYSTTEYHGDGSRTKTTYHITNSDEVVEHWDKVADSYDEKTFQMKDAIEGEGVSFQRVFAFIIAMGIGVAIPLKYYVDLLVEYIH